MRIILYHPILIDFVQRTTAQFRHPYSEFHDLPLPLIDDSMTEPAYLAISEFPPQKPVVIFVPSHKQCASTASDLLTYCLADDQEDRFLHIELEELEPHLEHVTDKTLSDCLKHGLGYFHESLNAQDKLIVSKLFQAGAIQVIVASRVR